VIGREMMFSSVSYAVRVQKCRVFATQSGTPDVIAEANSRNAWRGNDFQPMEGRHRTKSYCKNAG
jgi:hypothetical protein